MQYLIQIFDYYIIVYVRRQSGAPAFGSFYFRYFIHETRVP